MSVSAVPGETITFRRHAALPGVEIRDVEDSSRRWSAYSVGFEFLAPRTWWGDVAYRRRQHELKPGTVFCVHPGEVYSAPRVHRMGGFSALVIDPDLMGRCLAERGLPATRFELRRVVEMSDALAARLRDVVRAIHPSTEPLVAHSSLLAFVDAMAAELIEGWRPGSARGATDSNAADGSVNVADEARQPGVSRFRALRSFKRKYGLPPHAYQLRVRIGLAQRALRAGRKAADVAAEYGFVDQSHFSRHFKRMVGVTPARYASLACS